MLFFIINISLFRIFIHLIIMGIVVDLLGILGLGSLYDWVLRILLGGMGNFIRWILGLFALLNLSALSIVIIPQFSMDCSLDLVYNTFELLQLDVISLIALLASYFKYYLDLIDFFVFYSIKMNHYPLYYDLIVVY